MFAITACTFLPAQSIEPVKVLDYGLPEFEASYQRIVDERYMVGYRQGYINPAKLSVVDFHDPLSPQEVFQWDWPSDIDHCRVRFEGIYAYRHCYQDASQSFSVVNLENIFHPQLLFQETGEYDFNEFTVRDGYMYTLKKDLQQHRHRFAIWQVSNLEQIREVASIPLPSKRLPSVIEMGEHIFLYNNYAYFIGQGDGSNTVEEINSVIYAVDVSDPVNPHMILEFDGGRWKNRGGYASLAASDKYLFGGQYNVGLRIVDISDPNSLRTIGVLKGSSPIRELVVSGDTLYMLGDFRFRVVDISNPSRPKIVAQTDLRSYSGVVFGDYVYASNNISNGTYIFERWGD